MTALDPSPAAGYTDVHLVEEPFPTICYCSGLCVYEESLVHGHLVGRAWNAAGFINPPAERFDPSTHPTPQAFWIELDGQLLASHWEWDGLRREERDARCTPSSSSGTPSVRSWAGQFSRGGPGGALGPDETRVRVAGQVVDVLRREWPALARLSLGRSLAARSAGSGRMLAHASTGLRGDGDTPDSGRTVPSKASRSRRVIVLRRILAPGARSKKKMARSRGLYRSRRHRIIAGVAGGMAERFGLPVWFVRLVWLLLLLPGGLPGLLPYLICWVLIPAE